MTTRGEQGGTQQTPQKNVVENRWSRLEDKEDGLVAPDILFQLLLSLTAIKTSIIAAMTAFWLRHNLKIAERRLVVLYDIFAFSVCFCEIIFLYSSGFRVLLSGIFGSREH